MENKWLESVYSDGTESFVSNPSPALFETVTVWLRVYDDAPVEHIYLRTLPNGSEKLIEMQRQYVKNGLAYYSCEMQMTQTRMHYHFYLVCKDVIWFYTQKEITPYIPDHTYDFVLMTDYVQPAWVKDAVFYQIFPERFCNGDALNDVKDGEYQLNGHDTIAMKHWDDIPLEYNEGFCLDFFGGDLQGVKEKIPYLKELGVTAIYLNPIFLAPSVHKYDCIDYLHVDPHFGGDEALAELSQALHENGMKLMLDISINHTGTAHRWFNRDGLFFDKSEGAYNNPDSEERGYYFFKPGTNEYKGWFDVSDLPTLNYTAQSLRDKIYRSEDSVLRKWLKPPYSIDAWRFDVADVFARNNEIQLSHELWPQIRKSIRSVNPQAYILGEDWGDCAPYLQGAEWDSAMNYYGCGRVIRQFVGADDLYLMRHENLRGILYKMPAKDVKARVMEHLAKLPYAMWQNQFNLIDSHDVPRLHNDARVHPEEYRGAVMLLFALVGAANIYYGDEAQVDGTVATNEGCRYPMPWGKDFMGSETYNLYRTLAHLKADHKALRTGGMKFLYAEGNIVALARFEGDEAFVAVVSTDHEDQEILLPLGSIGCTEPVGEADVFGTPVIWQREDARTIRMKVEAHKAYFIRCKQA